MIPYFIIEVYPKLYLVCEFKKNQKKIFMLVNGFALAFSKSAFIFNITTHWANFIS